MYCTVYQKVHIHPRLSLTQNCNLHGGDLTELVEHFLKLIQKLL